MIPIQIKKNSNGEKGIIFDKDKNKYIAIFKNKYKCEYVYITFVELTIYYTITHLLSGGDWVTIE